MWPSLVVWEAANDSEFYENIQTLPNDTILKIFLERRDKGIFLQNASLGIKKYIGVFLLGYNYIVDFEKNYWNIFLTSTHSVFQKGIIHIFLKWNGYEYHTYDAFMATLTLVQMEYILSFFEKYINPVAIWEHRIRSILQQLRTRTEYLKFGIHSIS